ncbi:DUF63 family protein [Halalkalicoccus jeotgali]|uniref:DUF63 family protein n=1 Tax=Halalkalicoccus jeotgali (strain DSM 18796 / CECT 7217 / JCM 14584 / KCTC 4019 / B3) TaxID=795797 RepID=D8J368_HALJB|nr:DUF63 family protein [Halalkalicoccus jeotgali]ADJ15175.1 hypothetical protein HacjB3_08960 [Halalkalicoccus jeotgali B3]ELY35105.1 hypothetical protein C497_13720 [Halalkalicoccus jeotgali B3]
MNDLSARIDPARAWVAAALAALAALVVGSVVFPRRVYDGFFWRYFWGPVVADGTGSTCARRVGGETRLLDSAVECQQATGIVAEPGYTTVSTLSYAVVLVFALLGVVFFLKRLDIGTRPGFFFALFPFMLFGGALRTVEDASIATLRATGEPAIAFPLSGLFISPFIYFTVFFVTLGALLVSVAAERSGAVSRYEYPLAAIGTLVLAVTVGYLGWLAVTTDVLVFNPAVAIITFGGASVVAALAWVGTERFAPMVNAATGYMGVLVVWGHTVDGIANVLSLDWAEELGLPTYTPKHVVNSAIVDLTGALQPPSVSAAIGTAWPFLLVKIGAALFVVWVFNDEIFEESPQYSMLLLVAILAVGLGPGTRDTLRATFGI